VVCADNWNSEVFHHNMGILPFVSDRPDQCRSGREDEKDWLIEVILVTFSRLFVVLGRSPLCICKVREGAPYLSITYLAHSRSFFHHLL
jgi:hypothetical protein